MSAYYKVGRDTAKVPVNFNSWTLDTYGYQYPEASLDYTIVNEHVNVQDDHAALIREIGGASTVLLKNTNKALPLNKPCQLLSSLASIDTTPH
jgi:beta-glucosidase